MTITACIVATAVSAVVPHNAWVWGIKILVNYSPGTWFHFEQVLNYLSLSYWVIKKTDNTSELILVYRRAWTKQIYEESILFVMKMLWRNDICNNPLKSCQNNWFVRRHCCGTQFKRKTTSVMALHLLCQAYSALLLCIMVIMTFYAALTQTLLIFSSSDCGNSDLMRWNPQLMLCIRRRSLLLAISRRERLSWSNCSRDDFSLKYSQLLRQTTHVF